jgi:hypothetical protein
VLPLNAAVAGTRRMKCSGAAMQHCNWSLAYDTMQASPLSKSHHHIYLPPASQEALPQATRYPAIAPAFLTIFSHMEGLAIPAASVVCKISATHESISSVQWACKSLRPNPLPLLFFS